ncbi:MAG: RlmE family RNA methyltransferase [Alphaproteobacteria bacterium]
MPERRRRRSVFRPDGAVPGGRKRRSAAAARKGLSGGGKGRSASSKRWLERQHRDPYVAAAHEAGWRSRAAFKLIELDERFHLLARGRRVVDLGAAPGGWSQVAAARVGADRTGGGRVVAIDLQPFDPVPGVVTIEGDALAPDMPARTRAALGGSADAVLSDMAALATGHRATDHLRVTALCEAALVFAEAVLAPGGTFVCKALKGGAETELLARVKRRFATVRHAKPPASRAESREVYLVATGYRGGGEDERASGPEQGE